MPSIRHLFHIAAPSETVYKNITTVNGLSNWWTKETTGDGNLGGVLQFRFSNLGACNMKVNEKKENELLVWECVDGAEEWIGTILTFQLEETNGKTRVRFSQDGWKETSDFYASCNFSWGRYMESLRQLCQTGKGEAFGSENYRK